MFRSSDDICRTMIHDMKEEAIANATRRMYKKLTRLLLNDGFPLVQIAMLVGVSTDEASALIDEIKAEN